jgi:hypothetical protein
VRACPAWACVRQEDDDEEADYGVGCERLNGYTDDGMVVPDHESVVDDESTKSDPSSLGGSPGVPSLSPLCHSTPIGWLMRLNIMWNTGPPPWLRHFARAWMVVPDALTSMLWMTVPDAVSDALPDALGMW